MLGQQLLNGLVAGAVYALFALGFTLVFGVHRILNLAHGALLMAGAFIGLYAVQFGIPLWMATLLAMVGAGMLSILIDVAAFRRLRRQGQSEFGTIVASIGANLIVVSVAQRVSETKVLRFPFGTFPVVFFRAWGLRVSLLQLVIGGSVAVLLGLLTWLIFHTSAGRQMRAVAGNERAAVLLGVDPNAVYLRTFFLSGAMAGLAGVLVGMSFNSVHFLMGEPYLLRAFVVVILGGLGSIAGAVVAGLGLGILQTLTTAYLPSGLTDTIIFSLLFLVLLVRPNGLFGDRTASAGQGRQ